MKKIVAKTGGRPIRTSSLLALQEAVDSFEKFVAAYADSEISNLVVISGCATSLDNRTIESGILLFSVEGVFKLCTFDGYSIPAGYNRCFLYPSIVDVTDTYKNAEVKSVFTEYKIVVSLTYPIAKDVFAYDLEDGAYMPDFFSIIQNNSRLFVTQSEKNTWTGKANAVHTHTASQITESTTKRFVTDAEKSTWNAARSSAVADVLGGIAATWNTLQKLKTYTDAELAKKLNGSDVGVDWQEIDDLDPNTIAKLKYRRDAFGYVYLLGPILAKEVSSGYVLPDGFRPLAMKYFYVIGSETSAGVTSSNRGLWVKISTDGRITLCANDSGGGYTGSNYAMSVLNGINFLAVALP